MCIKSAILILTLVQGDVGHVSPVLTVQVTAPGLTPEKCEKTGQEWYERLPPDHHRSFYICTDTTIEFDL